MRKPIKSKTVKRTWKNSGWRMCADDRQGCPRYLRCTRCFSVVTHGQIDLGGCVCGERKLNPARELLWGEILMLKFGWYVLNSGETNAIRPIAPRLGNRLSHSIF